MPENKAVYIPSEEVTSLGIVRLGLSILHQVGVEWRAPLDCAGQFELARERYFPALVEEAKVLPLALLLA